MIRDYKEILNCNKLKRMTGTFILFTLLTLAPLMLAGISVAGSSGLIAYSRLTDGYWQIWVRNMSGSIDMQLTDTLQDKREPAWSAKGEKIVYRTNNGKLFIMDKDGRNRHQVLSRIGKLINPAWSPDNGRMAFARHRTDIKDDSDIWISDIKGENPLMMTNENGMQYMPDWSPDGSRLLYASANKPGRHRIMIMDPGKKSSRALTDSLANNMHPKWSPDGNEIVFVSKKAGNFDIWTMDINGKNLKQLTKDPAFDSAPSWSPDGNEIIFISNRTGPLQLWTVNVNGGKPAKLTTGNIECRDPAWMK